MFRITLTHCLTLGTLTLGALVLIVASAQAQEEMSREFCAECHDEAVQAFSAGAHGRAMAARSPETLDSSCVTCHTGAELHLEEFTAESIERWPSAAACRTCHPDAEAGLRRATPGHPRQAVGCLDCHEAGHRDAPAPALLASEPQGLCGDCHGEERNAFALPFTHRRGSEPEACTTCHAVHGGAGVGSFAMRGRLTMDGANGSCVSCHTEKSGPFIFPHAPREVDGCVSCHQPHGSANPRQLTRRTVLPLCLECHGDVPSRSFHDFTQARFRACQTCHRAVHGSNSDPRLLDE